MAHPALISLKNANVTLHNADGHFKVLHNINFCLNKGEHVAIIGQNGAGKSTFLRLLAGKEWVDQDAGSIAWQYMGKAEHSPIMGRRVTALVSPSEQAQYTRQEWQLSGEDILLTAFSDSVLLYSVPEDEHIKLAHAMASKLQASHTLKLNAAALSQGQLRLLLLGRALLQKPKVLLLDEYLDGLDTQSRTRIINVLQDISMECTLVITSHRKQAFLPCIVKEYFLQDGTLSSNKPQIILDKVNSHTLTHTTPMPQKSSNNKGAPQTRPIISLQNATVFVERTPVLKNINWDLHKGEHWLIEGKNGAGKSTFLRLLAGFEYPAFEGKIERYFARLYPNERNVNNLEEIRRATVLISDHEQVSYAYDLNGLEFMLSGLANVMGNYCQFEDNEYEQALTLLQRLGLKSFESRRVSTLSTGQLRRLFMARALMSSPEVLLLDEPFSGLDTNARTKCMEGLDILSNNLSIIMVSHHNADYLDCLNRQAHIEDGYLSAS